MGRKLYVGNLPYSATEQTLKVNEAKPKGSSGGGYGGGRGGNRR